MTKILITGSTGFIGTHLIPRLRLLQYGIFSVNHRLGDVAESSTWSSFPNADIVIHLAGRTFVPESWTDPVGFLRTNLNGTIYALNYCRERNARLIFISSYLYGIPETLPIAEDAPLQVNNPYALSKKLAEEACQFYSDYYGINITIIRPFNIYGPGQSTKFLIPSIVEQVLEGIAIKVKDLEPRRDYLYIDDLIDAFLCAIEKPQRYGIFNIASGTSHSVSEIIGIIQNIAKKKLPVHSDAVRREQEVMDTRADVTRAIEILGWRPRWSLNAGCTKILLGKDILE